MSFHFFSPPPRPADERARQAAVDASGLAGAAPDPMLDAIVAEAARLFAAPIAAISIVDRERQWFAARIGIKAVETSRAVSFCGHAIAAPASPLVVNDARADPRFAGNPLVLGAPAIRFYAGAAILGPDGLPLGTLCVIDDRPRMSAQPIDGLSALASQLSEMVTQIWRAA